MSKFPQEGVTGTTPADDASAILKPYVVVFYKNSRAKIELEKRIHASS